MDPDDSTKFTTAHDPKGLSYGAASVECSVSGYGIQEDLIHFETVVPDISADDLLL